MGCTFPRVAQGAAHQHAMTALLVCLADAALLGQPQGSALSCLALPYFRWFRAQGVPVKLMSHASRPEVPVKRKLQLTKAQSGPDRISSRHQAQQPSASQKPSRLLLCDFDKTIADFDAGESTGLFWVKASNHVGIHSVCRASQQHAVTAANLDIHCVAVASCCCTTSLCSSWTL